MLSHSRDQICDVISGKRYWTGQFDELMTSDLYNPVPNPDKNDEADPDSMFINPQSEYWCIKTE